MRQVGRRSRGVAFFGTFSRPQVCAMAVERGAELDVQDAAGLTAAMHAATNGHAEVCPPCGGCL